MSERHQFQARLPSAGQMWPPPFNTAEAAELEALLPGGANELNEVLLARVAKTAGGRGVPVAVA